MSKDPNKRPSLTQVFAVAAIGGLIYLGFQSNQSTKAQTAQATQTTGQSIPYTDFVTKAQNKQIKRIEVLPDGRLSGSAPGQPPVVSQQLPNDNIAARLENNIKSGDVTINVVPPKPQAEASSDDSGGGMMSGRNFMLFISFAPIVLLIGFYMWMMKSQQKGGSNIGGFGKSKARLVDENTNKITFADVAGCDEAKAEVEEIVDFLKDPQKYARLGGRIPRGALLVGPPGTGKTLLAKATAGEAKVPFFSISGSDFVEMFVGVGAARVRDLFENAKKNAPCIIFIDEIDAIGKQRGNGMHGNDEREQTLNAMLVEMDGFGADTGVIVMAATNRVDTLDKALLRPGRFDRHVFVGLPDINGREQILKVHARKVPLHHEVDLRVLARGTPGMAGADLANLVNEAALNAARRNGRTVDMHDFEEAKDKIYMGPQRNLAMSEENKRSTAWHESGHAIVGKLIPGNDPVHKVTIMPRGQALGLTWTLPDADSYSITHRQMLAQIKMFYGGRIAEELLAGGDKLSISTGASNDINRLTKMASSMVKRFGFHDPDDVEHQLAVAFYDANDNGQYEINSMEAHNEVTRQVQNLLRKCEQEARDLLIENRHILEAMANALIEHETIDAVEVDMIMKGESITERKRAERLRLGRETPFEKKAAGNDNVQAQAEKKRQGPTAP